MNFRTEISVKKVETTIEHHDPLLSLGSCFAENITTLLQERFFKVLENPFGTLYNPFSISQALHFIMEKKDFTRNDLFYHQGEWHSFWHHSSFSHHQADICLQNINQHLKRAHQFLKTAGWLIVTFGTAYVYFHKQYKIIVANCHKLPENHFIRRLIGIEEIVTEWRKLLTELNQFNPKLRIIFSVSPIRHLRDGLVQNQISKATLLLATHQLIKQQSHLFYFPAYEILLDDLRDYRFYEANLTHPNQQAITYIWEKFQEMFFSAKTQTILKELISFRKRLQHQFRNPASTEAKRFKDETHKLKEKLLQKYPYLDLSALDEVKI